MPRRQDRLRQELVFEGDDTGLHAFELALTRSRALATYWRSALSRASVRALPVRCRPVGVVRSSLARMSTTRRIRRLWK